MLLSSIVQLFDNARKFARNFVESAERTTGLTPRFLCSDFPFRITFSHVGTCFALANCPYSFARKRIIPIISAI